MIFWFFSIAGWFAVAACIAIWPFLTIPFMAVLILLLTSKAISLLHGAVWIWHEGVGVTCSLRDFECSSHPKPEAARFSIFKKLSQTSRRRSSFGVFDWMWFRAVELRRARGGKSKILAEALIWPRHLFYRFEALMVLATTALIFQPYSIGPGGECLSAAVPLLTWGLIAGVLTTITAMSIEVLLGNVIMGPGYDRYCHRHVERPIDAAADDGRDLLRAVFNFVRLAAFSLLATAGVFHGLHAALNFSGFRSAASATVGANGPTLIQDSLLTRLEMFVEFIAFTLTTFATVGYGDVYPSALVARSVVGCLHVIGMGMVVVLLQLILNRRGWPCPPYDAGRRSESI